MRRGKAIKKLEAIYARLPKLDCQKKCFTSCGPVPMTMLEWSRIAEQKKITDLPRVRGFMPYCPFLKITTDPQKRTCEVYENRPMMCRLFGLVKKMSCPYGCVPERWLTDDEAGELIQAIHDLERDQSGEVVLTMNMEVKDGI